MATGKQPNRTAFAAEVLLFGNIEAPRLRCYRSSEAKKRGFSKTYIALGEYRVPSFSSVSLLNSVNPLSTGFTDAKLRWG
jgi:hypothetical protein